MRAALQPDRYSVHLRRPKYPHSAYLSSLLPLMCLHVSFDSIQCQAVVLIAGSLRQDSQQFLCGGNVPLAASDSIFAFSSSLPPIPSSSPPPRSDLQDPSTPIKPPLRFGILIQSDFGDLRDLASCLWGGSERVRSDCDRQSRARACRA